MKNYILIAIIAIGALAASFSIGRYTATKEVVKSTDKVIDKDVRTETTETKRPDGTVITTTVKNSTTRTEVKNQTNTTVGNQPKLHVHALAGYDFSNKQPVYGAMVSRQLLGPVALGLFGMTNSVVGVSIGLEF